MKKTIFSATLLALALSVGGALAADLPHYKAPPPPPPPPPPLWTGFYVGLNAGYTWSDHNWVDSATFPVPAAVLGVVDGVPQGLAALATGRSPVGGGGGFLGGGQVGYNWQFMNSFVAGVEADIQGVASSGSGGGFTSAAVVVGVPVVSTQTATKSLDYIGTVRGRLGWLFTPTLLVYGTGGLAYGGVDVTTSLFQAGTNGFTGFANGGFSDTRAGWTAGGGLEWMFWPNWSAKIEYLYYDLGTVAYSSVPVSTFFATPVYGFSQNSARFNGNIVRAGVNYHFNWGAPAPVYAKY